MKRIIFLVLCCGFLTNIYAQIPQPPKNLQSPNAASLGLYGEVPVSLFTGTPSIEIPIYEIKQFNSRFPISLSYHSAGIRPDQHPGWTGMGWNLNSGGIITRNVKDLQDECINTHLAPSNGNLYYCGFYYNHNVLNVDNWNQRDHLRYIAQHGEALFTDTEPDEFNFNFFGYSGKFFIDEGGNWKVQSNKPLKVIFDNQYLDIPFDISATELQNFGCPPSFKGFTIVAEDGTKYIFGGSTSAIEYSINFFNQLSGNWLANSWSLTKIILPNGAEINYVYERGDFINQMYLSVTHDLGTFGNYQFDTGLFTLNLGCKSTNYSSVEKNYQGQLISPIYLKSISSSDCTISFERSFTMETRYSNTVYDDKYFGWMDSHSMSPFLLYLNSTELGYPQCLDKLKWYKLDKILVKGKDNSIIKDYNLIYDNSGYKRLFLMNIVAKGPDGFSYTTTLDYYNRELLPSYLSNKVDHWGYFNNRYATLDYPTYYSLRETDPLYSAYGVLTKIIYPTGGYTRFVFEPHQYRKQLRLKRWESCDELTENKYAGGLRIKQIINSPTGNSLDEYIDKEYYYTSDYLQNKTNSAKSSGILGGQIQYFFDNYIVYSFNDNDAKLQKRSFSSQSVLPACSNTSGNHIGYTEVIEKQFDNSFTRNIFTNFDNGRMDESADAVIQFSSTPYEPYNSKEQERGLIALQEQYNQTGAKVARTVSNYVKSDVTSNNYIRALKAGYFEICPGNATHYDEGSAYKNYTYSMLLSNKKEVYYINSDSLIKETSYTYDSNFPILTNQTEKDSRGDSFTTVYTYPFHIDRSYLPSTPQGNITSPCCTRTIPSTLYSYCRNMNSRNMLSLPVEITKYKNNKVTGSQLFFYGNHNNNYVPDFIYSTETTTPMTNFLRFGDSYWGPTTIDSRYEASPSLSYLYDGMSNIIQSIDKDNMPIAYLWGYNYQYPIAEIKNATYDQVKTALGDALITRLATSATPLDADLATLNALRTSTSLPNIMVTTYTYKPLVGMLSSTSPNGLVTTFEYDPLNRLKYIIDHNGKIITEDQYHYKQ